MNVYQNPTTARISRHDQVVDMKDVRDVNANENRADPKSELVRLKRIVNVLQTCMACFGLYYTIHAVDCKTEAPSWEPILKKRVSKRLKMSYNIFVIVLMWMNVIRCLVSAFSADLDTSDVSLKVTSAFWFVSCALNVTLMLKASHPKTGHMCKACDHWTQKVFVTMDNLHVDCDTKPLRRKLVVGFVLAWMCIMINNLAICVTVVYPDITANTRSLGELFVHPFPFNTGTQLLGVILGIYCNAAWVFPMLYVICFSSILSYCFRVCAMAIEKEVKNPRSREAFSSRLCLLRRLHLDISNTVEIMDKDVGILFANWYLTNLPIACFTVFLAITTELDTFMLATNLFWLGATVIALMCTSGFVAHLNRAAHSPLEHIYEICMVGVTLEEIGQVSKDEVNGQTNLRLVVLLFQVQLFLSKLTGTTIGFSVMKFFVITKEVLLTVCGLYITYFFVLLSFNG